MQNLRSVIPVVSSISSSGCEFCDLGKHHRATYLSRVTSRRSPFEFVHSDVWGPNRVPLLKDFRYFLLFIMTSLA